MTTDQSGFDTISDMTKWEQTSRVLEPLIASPSRLKIFKVIYENPGMRNKDVAAEAGVTSGTVSHVCEELSNWNLISRDKEIRLTVFGELVAQQIIELSETTGVIGQLQPFLKLATNFGDVDFSEVIPLMTNLKVVDGDNYPTARYEYRDFIESADRVRELLPFRIGEGPFILDQLENELVEMELIFPYDFMEDFPSHEREVEMVTNIWELGGGILVSDQPLPGFIFAVSEDEVLFLATGGNNEVVVRCYDEEVYDWASSLYETYRASSVEYDLDED